MKLCRCNRLSVGADGRVLRFLALTLALWNSAAGQDFSIWTVAGGLPLDIPATSIGLDISGVEVDAAGNISYRFHR